MYCVCQYTVMIMYKYMQCACCLFVAAPKTENMTEKVILKQHNSATENSFHVNL